MEAVCFPETLVYTYNSARRYNLEEKHRQYIKFDRMICQVIQNVGCKSSTNLSNKVVLKINQTKPKSKHLDTV
jgi:hypothetical protein